MQGNALDGSCLDAWLPQLQALEQLSLADNQLARFSVRLAQLPALSKLWLYGNCLRWVLKHTPHHSNSVLHAVRWCAVHPAALQGQGLHAQLSFSAACSMPCFLRGLSTLLAARVTVWVATKPIGTCPGLCGTPWPVWHALACVACPGLCGMPWPVWHALACVALPGLCGMPWPVWHALAYVACPGLCGTIQLELPWAQGSLSLGQLEPGATCAGGSPSLGQLVPGATLRPYQL